MTTSSDPLCVPSEPVDERIFGRVTAEWLVSVRDENELARAVCFCVDIVDLKEPDRGALAPVDIEFWARAVKLMEQVKGFHGSALQQSSPRLSAALGERDQALAVASDLPHSFSYAKAGPSGCASGESIRRLWTDVSGQLPPPVELVAVAYADAKAARCVEPESVLVEAHQSGLKCCLLDTFTKDGRSSLQHLGLERLAEFGGLARRLGIWWALAGSITRADVAVLTQSGIEPNCLAVRGDVCRHDRKGAICQHRMQAWSRMFADKDAHSQFNS